MAFLDGQGLKGPNRMNVSCAMVWISHQLFDPNRKMWFQIVAKWLKITHHLSPAPQHWQWVTLTSLNTFFFWIALSQQFACWAKSSPCQKQCFLSSIPPKKQDKKNNPCHWMTKLTDMIIQQWFFGWDVSQAQFIKKQNFWFLLHVFVFQCNWQLCKTKLKHCSWTGQLHNLPKRMVHLIRTSAAWSHQHDFGGTTIATKLHVGCPSVGFEMHDTVSASQSVQLGQLFSLAIIDSSIFGVCQSHHRHVCLCPCPVVFLPFFVLDYGLSLISSSKKLSFRRLLHHCCWSAGEVHCCSNTTANQ